MASGEAVSADEYFSSYEDLNVHKLMLRDEPRTRAYQMYIEENKSLFIDKIVVDVGAGTGILSLFAAKAGAKRVYAIEASGVADICREIVAENDLDDVVKVIHGRVEDVSLPDGVEADVIVSEWMGFYLLHESMLQSVIVARDRWLKPDGVMVPSAATIRLAPVSMIDFYQDNFMSWNNVYGFNFSPVIPRVKASLLSSPQIQTINQAHLCAEPLEFFNMDLKFVDFEDLKRVPSHLKFTLSRNGLLHGLACWFDVEFGEGEHPRVLSTGPADEPTHWKQTIVLLPEVLLVNKGDDLACNVELERSTEHPRRYNISVEIPEEEEEEEEENAEGREQFDSATADMIVAAMENTDH